MKYKKLISIAISALCVSLISAVTAFADETMDESYGTEAVGNYDDYYIESYDNDLDPVNGTTLGDLNGDGKIDSSDASEVLGYYALVSTNQPTFWSEIQIWAGDVNGDGITDSTDASDILAYYAYMSTLPKGAPQLDIMDFIENPPVTTTAATTTVTTTTETTTTTVTTTVNYCRAPEGLDPGKKGSIEYIVNTAELQQRDCIRFYNIKADNGNGGVPIETNDTDYITDRTIEVLNNFAKEHFTDDMTNYDRLKYTWEWLHFNVQYADGKDGRPTYAEIWGIPYAEACFEKKAGQCVQYNGAFAEMMAYMGYDVYMIEMWTRPDNTGQHFRSEAVINGVVYNTEVGETASDSPPGYYWMWLFRSDKAQIKERP